jgi:hypothetical protein
MVPNERRRGLLECGGRPPETVCFCKQAANREPCLVRRGLQELGEGDATDLDNPLPDESSRDWSAPLHLFRFLAQKRAKSPRFYARSPETLRNPCLSKPNSFVAAISLYQ